MESHNRVRESKVLKGRICARMVQALSQVTMCVAEEVEKQSILTVWDKVKRWSP
jgi:hypothetical protein